MVAPSDIIGKIEFGKRTDGTIEVLARKKRSFGGRPGVKTFYLDPKDDEDMNRMKTWIGNASEWITNGMEGERR